VVIGVDKVLHFNNVTVGVSVLSYIVDILKMAIYKWLCQFLRKATNDYMIMV